MLNKNLFNEERKDQKLFDYEKDKINKVIKFLPIITFSTHLLTFLFFLLIGKLENDDAMLSQFQSILALATTVLICVNSIIGAIYIRKAIVSLYIGAKRARLFLFPIKRSQLFMTKNDVAVYLVWTQVSCATIVAVICEILLSKFLGIDISFSITSVLSYFEMITTGVLLILTIILISELAAIWKQSEVVTIITGVLGVLFISNISAFGMANRPFMTLILAIMLYTAVSYSLHLFANRINQMEVY